MANNVVLFEDGKAMVDGIEADALGPHHDLPFLTEEARLAAAGDALAEDDRGLAESIAARGVVRLADELHTLTVFVSPPDWDRFSAALWDEESGTAHAVFTLSTKMVDGVAVQGCVGARFEDEAARRECALWCLRNGLDEIAERVTRTPLGGDGPHCTWPDVDISDEREPIELEDPYEPEHPDPVPSEPDEERAPEAPSNVVSLFGGVFP